MSLRAALLAVLLAAPGAFAAPAVDEARAALERQRTEAATLREQQHALRLELNGVGDRIAQLKAASRGSLLRQNELDQALKRSQALSEQLTALSARIAQADAGATRAQQAVVGALSAELQQLREQFEKTQDRDRRRELITRMRAVRTERERFEAALPRTSAPTLSAGASDDPEELLEQADALRDSRDKVNKRLEAVRRRVHELRREQELDERMSEFVKQESLFDEHDRRLARSGEVTAVAGDFQDAPERGPQGVSDGPQPTTSPSPERFRDPQPELGAPAPDDLRGLEAETKRLEGMAAELEQRARDAERRALELR